MRPHRKKRDYKHPTILTLRGLQVILDFDLASLYGVSVEQLNKQVKRQTKRFPFDFAFQLTHEEFADLKLSFPALKWNKKPPTVFNENGILMAALMLQSSTAIKMSILMIRELEDNLVICDSRIPSLKAMYFTERATRDTISQIAKATKC